MQGSWLGSRRCFGKRSSEHLNNPCFKTTKLLFLVMVMQKRIERTFHNPLFQDDAQLSLTAT